MFCKVVFVKRVHLASWEDTQFRVFLFLEWKFATSTGYILSVHEIIILLYKLIIKPCMNVEEKILHVIFME